MARSVQKKAFVDYHLIEKITRINEKKAPKKPIKTWSRRSTITPDFIGFTFDVHNGRKFISIFITEDMVGHKLGEFAPTRTFHGHGKDKGKK